MNASTGTTSESVKDSKPLQTNKRTSSQKAPKFQHLSREFVIVLSLFATGTVSALLAQIGVSRHFTVETASEQVVIYRDSRATMIPISLLFGLGTGSSAAISLLLSRQEQKTSGDNGRAAAQRINQSVSDGINRLSDLIEELYANQQKSQVDFGVNQRAVQRQLIEAGALSEGITGALNDTVAQIEMLVGCDLTNLVSSEQQQDIQYPADPAGFSNGQSHFDNGGYGPG